MKSCRKFEDLQARYLHGGVLLQEKESLEKHLAACPECERLYLEVGEVDHLLREFPGKVVEPPAWLRARILSNLPDPEALPFRRRAFAWIAASGVAAACVLALAVGLYRDTADREIRVASAPPPSASRVAPAPPAPVAATPSSPSSHKPAGRSPAISSVHRPGGGTEAGPAPVSPRVEVIKEVKIFFYYPPAGKVAVTGDFNGWSVEGVPMHAAGKPGLWTTDLRVPPGVYSYNFIVDGELLLPDPDAPNQMPDGYGGTNSILMVEGEKEI